MHAHATPCSDSQEAGEVADTYFEQKCSRVSLIVLTATHDNTSRSCVRMHVHVKYGWRAAQILPLLKSDQCCFGHACEGHLWCRSTRPPSARPMTAGAAKVMAHSNSMVCCSLELVQYLRLTVCSRLWDCCLGYSQLIISHTSSPVSESQVAP